MTMTPTIAAARIARSVAATEQSFEQALLASTRLMTELVSARIEVGEPSTGQAALMRLAKAQTMLIDAQSEVLRTHGALRDVARERGDIPQDCPTEHGAASLAA